MDSASLPEWQPSKQQGSPRPEEAEAVKNQLYLLKQHMQSTQHSSQTASEGERELAKKKSPAVKPESRPLPHAPALLLRGEPYKFGQPAKPLPAGFQIPQQSSNTNQAPHQRDKDQDQNEHKQDQESHHPNNARVTANHNKKKRQKQKQQQRPQEEPRNDSNLNEKSTESSESDRPPVIKSSSPKGNQSLMSQLHDEEAEEQDTQRKRSKGSATQGAESNPIEPSKVKPQSDRVAIVEALNTSFDGLIEPLKALADGLIAWRTSGVSLSGRVVAFTIAVGMFLWHDARRTEWKLRAILSFGMALVLCSFTAALALLLLVPDIFLSAYRGFYWAINSSTAWLQPRLGTIRTNALQYWSDVRNHRLGPIIFEGFKQFGAQVKARVLLSRGKLRDAAVALRNKLSRSRAQGAPGLADEVQNGGINRRSSTSSSYQRKAE